MVALSGGVVGVCVGAAKTSEVGGRVHQTAFVKEPVAGRVPLGSLGLEGDQHVYHDHGGVDQALLVYSVDHYRFWREEHHLDLPDVGAFGENLTVEGLTEIDVCIGDKFQIGEAVTQITSPRTPCYKIGVRYDDRQLPVVMQDVGNTGYLLRVLSEGDIEAGDSMTLVDRPTVTMTVWDAGRVVVRDRDDWATIEKLATLPELANGMRHKLEARLLTRSLDSEDARLFGDGEAEPTA